jgi:hypothetical protein
LLAWVLNTLKYPRCSSSENKLYLLHLLLYKSQIKTGLLRINQKRYVKENIYFACFLPGNQKKYQKDQLMVYHADSEYNLKASIWSTSLVKVNVVLPM